MTLAEALGKELMDTAGRIECASCGCTKLLLLDMTECDSGLAPGAFVCRAFVRCRRCRRRQLKWFSHPTFGPGGRP